ncbi:hypothetical protein SDC9_182031 [bioreactor metagenome]|uniref:Uncharacterized protein n=1 Tax=bioreactor metagenome TaxID=1076179 RepID=A0A645H686_9ZZZZ
MKGVVVQQVRDGIDDASGVRADDGHRARRHSLGAFGDIAHHQHGLAEEWRLFLHAARIGEDDVRALHHPDEVQIVQRFDEMDALAAVQG